MKRIVLPVLILLCGQSGCERRPSIREGKAIAEAHALIEALSTNASVRVITQSDAVREKLKDVKEKAKRDAVITEWRKSLKNISVDGLRPSDRYWSVREACHVLNLDLAGAMREAGFSYEERWDAYLDTIKWLDRQIDAMKPRTPTTRRSRSEQNEEWDNYQALVEYRETEIENLEIHGFDVNLCPNDVREMDAIREKFENLIGRPVRKREDITRLGFYEKQARARIQKERDAALKKSVSRE